MFVVVVVVFRLVQFPSQREFENAVRVLRGRGLAQVFRLQRVMLPRLLCGYIIVAHIVFVYMLFTGDACLWMTVGSTLVG